MLLDFAKIQTYKSRMVSRQIEFSRSHSSAEKAERLIREYWAETGRGIPRRLVSDVLGMSAVRLSHIIRSLEESGAISPGRTLLYPAGGKEEVL